MSEATMEVCVVDLQTLEKHTGVVTVEDWETHQHFNVSLDGGTAIVDRFDHQTAPSQYLAFPSEPEADKYIDKIKRDTPL